MFDTDRWNEIFKTLKSNKLRTFLTAFGIFWGIFMLMIMLGAGEGLKNGVTHQFGDFATNSFFIWTQKTSKPYKGLKRDRWWHFESTDIQAIIDRVPEADMVSPGVNVHTWRGGSNRVVYGLNAGTYNIRGQHPTINKIDPMIMLDGRFINMNDMKERRKVVAIGKRVVEELFDKNEKAVGQYVRMQGAYFQVVGAFESKHSQGWGDYQNKMVIMPASTLQQVYNYGDMIDYIAITAEENFSATLVMEKVKSLLKERHKIHPEDEKAIGANNIEEEFKKMKGLFGGIHMIIWIVGLGTLMAGAIGVSNIMLVTVKERTKEIGIKRAIGATPKRIISQILSESLVLTFIAGYLGLLAGIGVVELVNKMIAKANPPTFRNPEVDITIAVVGISVIVICGLLAGVLPGKRALKIKPIEAIRDVG